MSDSLWPHRHQPTRLCHPWDSPGKNTGVGCHFLLQGSFAISCLLFMLSVYCIFNFIYCILYLQNLFGPFFFTFLSLCWTVFQYFSIQWFYWIILFMYWFPGFIELSFLIFTYSSPSFLKTVILNSLLDKLQIFISLRLATEKLLLFFLWCHVSLIVCITWSFALLSSPLKWQSPISFLMIGFGVEIFSVTPARHSEAFSDLF